MATNFSGPPTRWLALPWLGCTPIQKAARRGLRQAMTFVATEILLLQLLLRLQNAGHDALRAGVIAVGKECQLWINDVDDHMDRRNF